MGRIDSKRELKLSLLHILLVAIIQGITEFLPVSSSAHLILLPNLTGLDDQGLAIDVAVHVGTLFAVLLYFWQDVRLAISGIPRLLRGRIDTPGAKLALLLGVATVPVVIAGFILKVTGLSDDLRSIAVIGWTMIIFGIVLYWADQTGPETKSSTDWTIRDSVVMGLWQAVALIPGTSRSGITITASRFLGYTRQDGAKLAMLMSIPTIIASGVLLGVDVVASDNRQVTYEVMMAASFAFIAALFALTLMMRLLKSVSFTPYVIYRVVLGIILLWIAYT